jgi:hypothetical protein
MCIQFFRPRATGRIEFSARLLLRSSSGYSSKYCKHTPLHRQSVILKRDIGLEISRATLDGWVLKVGELLQFLAAWMLAGSARRAMHWRVLTLRLLDHFTDDGLRFEQLHLRVAELFSARSMRS